MTGIAKQVVDVGGVVKTEVVKASGPIGTAVAGLITNVIHQTLKKLHNVINKARECAYNKLETVEIYSLKGLNLLDRAISRTGEFTSSKLASLSAMLIGMSQSLDEESFEDLSSEEDLPLIKPSSKQELNQDTRFRLIKI